MKLLTIVGARPQFIKAATVSRVIRGRKDIHEILLHTGQHFDTNMSDIFFEEMDIPKPDYHLGIAGGHHGEMTGHMLAEIERVILAEKPDRVLVYGDTNSTLAGALAAAKLHVPVAHVEAGLRSYNMRMPEEINRILTDRVSDLLFCPTHQAVQNLQQEGFAGFNCRIEQVGDVMYDAALFYRDRARRPGAFPASLPEGGFALVTLHRAENTDDLTRLAAIVTALNQLHPALPIAFPMHPRTRASLEAAHLKLETHVIAPVGYLEMIWLLKHCQLVLTDSGGLQKEAYFFRKPCVTLRDETEWVELVDAGVNVLAGADSAKIQRAVDDVLRGTGQYDQALYGDGFVAEDIVSTITSVYRAS